MNEMTFAQRARLARKNAKLERKDVVHKSGISYTALADIENGQSFASVFTSTLASIYGVSGVWLETGKGRMEISHSLAADAEEIGSCDDVVIHQFDTGGRMGNGLVLQDQPGVIESWRVSKEWAAKNIKNCSSLTNLVVVTGFGDSMRPMFNPGDPLLVDTGVREMNIDAVYFFRVGNEGYIKRIQRIPSKDGTIYRVRSANPDYETWEVTAGMDVEVFGRVLKVWRGEDM